MNALWSVAVAAETEAESLRRQLKATQARLDAELQRCGRAEGKLSVVEQQLADTKKRLDDARKATLAHWDTVLELRAQLEAADV